MEPYMVSLTPLWVDMDCDMTATWREDATLCVTYTCDGQRVAERTVGVAGRRTAVPWPVELEGTVGATVRVQCVVQRDQCMASQVAHSTVLNCA